MTAKKRLRDRVPITEIPHAGLLKLDDVLRFVPVSRATWFRGVKAGNFPQPMRLNTLTFWHARDIRYLIDHRFKPKRRRAKARAAPLNAHA